MFTSSLKMWWFCSVMWHYYQLSISDRAILINKSLYWPQCYLCVVNLAMILNCVHLCNASNEQSVIAVVSFTDSWGRCSAFQSHLLNTAVFGSWKSFDISHLVIWQLHLFIQPYYWQKYSQFGPKSNYMSIFWGTTHLWTHSSDTTL